MNKRLAFLEQMVESGQADSFARYGLAMEYRKEKQFEQALATFTALRDDDPDYLAMYLMAGQMLLEQENQAEARPWLEAGIEVAKKQGNGQALGELEDALEDC